MATVHIRDIQRWLVQSGQRDAAPGPGGMFLEIRFDEPDANAVVDEEMRNRVITADSPQGSVTIVFDDIGRLRSLDIS
jgi:hypothetical protein